MYTGGGTGWRWRFVVASNGRSYNRMQHDVSWTVFFAESVQSVQKHTMLPQCTRIAAEYLHNLLSQSIGARGIAVWCLAFWSLYGF